MKTELTNFDISDYLTDKQAVAEYLEACLIEGGIPLFLKGMGEAARASGMSEIAELAGVTRASLYKSLSESGTPALATIDKVMGTLGVRIAIEPLPDMVILESKMERTRPTEAGVQVAGAYQRQARVQEPKLIYATVSRGSKMSSNKSKGPADYRSSKTGEFVKKDYAQKHPATTEKEHNRPPPKPTKK